MLLFNITFHTFVIGANQEEGHTSDAKKRNDMCYCGRKAKSRIVRFCTSDEKNKSRCPCVANKRFCSPTCRCLNCMNRMIPNEFKGDQKCRCGEFIRNSKTDKSITKTCADIPGARRTKCPCYISKQACNAKCSCRSCENEYGKRESQGCVIKEKGKAKCTSSPSSVKRKRAAEYHREHGIDIKHGTWTLLETCLLESVESFLFSTSIIPSVHNVTVLYNYIVDSLSSSRNNPSVCSKTIEQVNGKLIFTRKRQETLKNLLYGIALMAM